jgi:hypothetical protein
MCFVSVVLLFFPACKAVRVVKPIKEGQAVMLDPCRLLTKADAEEIFGSPATDPSVRIFASKGAGQFRCIYQKLDGPDYGELVSIETLRETQATLRTFYAGKSMNIGKESRLVSGVNDLRVNVLTKEGVQYELVAAAAGKDLVALTDSVEKLSVRIHNRIEKQFPGSFKPPALTAAPKDPCALLGPPELSPEAGYPGPDGWAEGTAFFRFESFGGRWGGEWSCEYYTQSSADEGGLNNSIEITLAKANVTMEDMKRLQGQAAKVNRLGAYAYWLPQELSVATLTDFQHDRNWLAVMTRGGHRFEVELSLHEPQGEDVNVPPEGHKQKAIGLARRVLPKLP